MSDHQKINDYYDRLVNQIDDYTNQLLNTINDEQQIQTSNEKKSNKPKDSNSVDQEFLLDRSAFNSYWQLDSYSDKYFNNDEQLSSENNTKSVKMKDYINGVRLRAIEAINKARDRHYNHLISADSKATNELLEKTYCSVINLEINSDSKFVSRFFNANIIMPRFSLFTISLDFSIDKTDLDLIKSLIIFVSIFIKTVKLIEYLKFLRFFLGFNHTNLDTEIRCFNYNSVRIEVNTFILNLFFYNCYCYIKSIRECC